MERYTFVKDYKTNDELRAKFNELATNTFEIDFEPWYKLGFWNDRYICYSYFHGDKIVSNVSVNIIDTIVAGENIRTVQIGTVMTHPDYRKKGLASRLMEKVFSNYENEVDLFCLFCAEENFNFYMKHGFTAVQESKFTVKVNPLQTENHLRKLLLKNEVDKKLLIDAYTNKVSSHEFDIENAEHVLGFYGVLAFGNDLYFSEKLNTAVIFKVDGEKLHLYAVLSEEKLLFNDLINEIASEDVSEVVFHFTPDFEDIQPHITDLITSDDVFHIRTSNVKLPQNFKFPLIAHA